MKNTNLHNRPQTASSLITLTVTAMLMSMNIALSSFGIPVPGGHFYLNDIVICTAAILLDPLHAFVACGIGAFLGDFFFYPAPMFVSLVTHGLQAVVISVLSHRPEKSAEAGIRQTVFAVLTGAVIMVTGYTLGRAFLYSTPQYAVLKLPYQILQAVVGLSVSLILCFRFGIRNTFMRMVLR